VFGGAEEVSEDVGADLSGALVLVLVGEKEEVGEKDGVRR
jgi:hypothetical protein